MPQGGIGFDETPGDAVRRELREETGLTDGDLELLSALDEWLVYELPELLRSPRSAGARRSDGSCSARLGAQVKPDGAEFTAFSGLAPDELVNHVVEFRGRVYRRVFTELSPWL